MILAKLIEDFLTHCEYERGLDHKTLKAYRIDLTQFTSSLENEGDTNIESVDREVVRKYLRETCSAFKPRTIRRKIACLKSFFGHLELEDTITVSPFRKMRITIKAPREIPKTISLTNIKKLFRYVYAELGKPLQSEFQRNTLLRDMAVLELLFATGMRVSEIATLTEEQVKLSQKQIHVKGKGNKERIIPICADEVKKSLQEYLKVRGRKSNSSFFINRLGKTLSAQSIRFMVKKYAKLAKVKLHITPHMFRHTMATQLLDQGMDIRYIQDLLGHSSITTTQIYAHVSDSSKRKELRRRHPRRNMQFINIE